MTKLILGVFFFGFITPALAQPYPSPTFQNLTTLGAFSVLNSITGPVTNDYATITGATRDSPTAQELFNQSVNSGSPTIFQSLDAVRGVADANASSTVNTVTGVAGYTRNDTVPIGQRTQTVSLLGIAVCAVNSSQCWGLDTIVSDNPSVANTGVTTGTGKLLYNELDLDITSPNTGGGNLMLGGTALPTNVILNANALSINKLWGAGGSGTGTALFSIGMILQDACCASAIAIGSNALSGTAQKSMPLLFNYWSGNASYQNLTFQGVSDATLTGGTLYLNGSGSYANLGLANGSLLLPSNKFIEWNNNDVLWSDGTATINLGATGPWTGIEVGTTSTMVNVYGSLNLGNAGTITTINSSTTTLGNPATGTPIASLCLDGSNHIIKKTTAGSCI